MKQIDQYGYPTPGFDGVDTPALRRYYAHLLEETERARSTIVSRESELMRKPGTGYGKAKYDPTPKTFIPSTVRPTNSTKLTVPVWMLYVAALGGIGLGVAVGVILAVATY